ncbi:MULTISPECIES: HAD-IB family phosphatase [Methylomonas]|uniref:phosphoserine phosphatase n=1 Tax=Methylomonas koyamae TaxID=702114 RepID=A0A177NBN2_9GAMM|nr:MULTISPECIES: HAD-IB family phosphatase [Methylomonas]OAI15295.1 haloacid dehalogenase [Methylomonas koyamae]OHX35400.1 haloacid dehalogenase [Methylomonas sp. LWB]WGS85367.1 HAD-IB family phosphatase [Methylomonas sp. UP202]
MKFDVICFDCDSTLSRVEGIDELARRNGLFEQVAALTDAAMNGELPLEEVYAKRLELIRPDRAAIAWLAQLYLDEIVDGVKETVDSLLAHGKEIHIVSGGLRQAILPLADYLGIPEANVHAVDVEFDAVGQYLGFAVHSPLAVSGGKARICRRLRMRHAALAMVGDGKTDLEAKQAGAYMVGFGGVVRRPMVEAEADCYVIEPSLMAVLPYLL